LALSGGERSEGLISLEVSFAFFDLGGVSDGGGFLFDLFDNFMLSVIKVVHGLEADDFDSW
jgi:hypothetical protein